MSYLINGFNQSNFDLTNATEFVSEECYPFQTAFEAAQLYYLPTIIFIGLIGNILSCIVFLNTHLKMRSSSYYLAALACADSGFLAALLLVWLSSHLDLPVFNENGYCQCIVYLSSVCSFLSVWLIVAFTVERFIAVQYPLHRPLMCTVARAKAIISYLTLAAAISNSYVFITSGIIDNGGVYVCEMLQDYHRAMWIINILDFLVTLIIPIVLIVVMNTMITINLFKFSRRFRRHDACLDKSSFMMTEVAEINHQGRKISKQVNEEKSDENIQRLSYHSSKSNKESFYEGGSKNLTASSKCKQVATGKTLSTKIQYSITKMLLLISTVFVLLNLPSYGIRLYVFVFTSIWMEPPPIHLWCLQQMLMYLYYTNFSINFLFYSMYGVTFRRCLWQLLRNKVKRITVKHCSS